MESKIRTGASVNVRLEGNDHVELRNLVPTDIPVEDLDSRSGFANQSEGAHQNLAGSWKVFRLLNTVGKGLNLVDITRF